MLVFSIFYIYFLMARYFQKAEKVEKDINIPAYLVYKVSESDGDSRIEILECALNHKQKLRLLEAMLGMNYDKIADNVFVKRKNAPALGLIFIKRNS